MPEIWSEFSLVRPHPAVACVVEPAGDGRADDCQRRDDLGRGAIAAARRAGRLGHDLLVVYSAFAIGQRACHEPRTCSRLRVGRLKKVVGLWCSASTHDFYGEARQRSEFCSKLRLAMWRHSGRETHVSVGWRKPRPASSHGWGHLDDFTAGFGGHFPPFSLREFVVCWRGSRILGRALVRCTARHRPHS